MATDVILNIGANTAPLENDLRNAGNNLPPNVTPGGGSGVVPPTPGGGGGGTPVPAPQPQPQTPQGGGQMPAMPTYDRMAQDIRREIMSRGVMLVPGSSNFNQLMQTVERAQRNRNYDDIKENNRDRLAEKAAEWEAQRQKITDEIDEQRNKRLAANPNNADSINSYYDNIRDTRLTALRDKFQPQIDAINQEVEQEKLQSDKELARVMRDLINELKQGNPDSYLKNMRQEYAEAVWKRDNAGSRDELVDANREVARIQRQMSEAMADPTALMMKQVGGYISGAMSVGRVAGDIGQAYIANTSSKISEINAAMNGDAFGAAQTDYERRKRNFGTGLTAGGAALGAIIGAVATYFTGGAAAPAMGWGAGIGTTAGGFLSGTVFDLMHADERHQYEFGKLWADQENKTAQMNSFMMMIQSQHGGLENSRDYWLQRYDKENERWMYPNFDANQLEYSIYDLGYTLPQFTEGMAQRMSQRGYFRNEPEAISYTMKADALEKVYGMGTGSLGQLSSYDRYGNNANQDMANLVASLSSRNVLGMNNGRYLRSNEFMNYQMQLMEMQKSYAINPNATRATQQLLAAQSVYGNALDSRGIQTIGNVENAITNPQEGMAKVMLYDVIQDTFKETRGDMLAIRKAMYDPDKRQKIQQAYIKRITETYGGADTFSGYSALSQILGEENPFLVDKWEDALTKPQAVTKGDIKETTKGVQGYTASVSKDLLKYQDTMLEEVRSKLGGIADATSKMLTQFDKKLQDIVDELKH